MLRISLMLVTGLLVIGNVFALNAGEAKQTVTPASEAKQIATPASESKSSAAETKPAATAKVRARKFAAKQKETTPEEREKNALEFVTEHHPELAEILAGLKENKPQEFQRGLREIQGVSQRIAKFREKQPERYALEVQVWKAGSRARLLAAQGAMDDAASNELKEQIKSELLSQEEGKLKLLEYEQAELQKRLETLQGKLKNGRDGIETRVNQGADKLLSSAKKQQEAIEKRKEQAAKRKIARTKEAPKEGNSTQVTDEKPATEKKPVTENK